MLCFICTYIISYGVNLRYGETGLFGREAISIRRRTCEIIDSAPDGEKDLSHQLPVAPRPLVSDEPLASFWAFCLYSSLRWSVT